jgi:hypothetical protein
MAQVRYKTADAVQVGADPGSIRAYGGPDRVGETEDVPADVADLLVEAGIAERVAKAVAKKR